jgi:polar amino acid transport system substrate-binding protein
MMSFTPKALILLFICSFSAQALTEKTDALTIYTEQFPPYNFKLDNKLVGINLELTKAACELAKIDCQFELYPWNRSMKLAPPQEQVKEKRCLNG